MNRCMESWHINCALKFFYDINGWPDWGLVARNIQGFDSFEDCMRWAIRNLILDPTKDEWQIYLK